MATKPKKRRLDPATGKQLPKGVTYRGQLQYRAQFSNKANGKRIGETFETATDAKLWLEEQRYLSKTGRVEEKPTVDELKGQTVRDLVIRYRDEVIDTTKKNGSTGHLKCLISTDFSIGDIDLSELKYTHVRDWRNEMKVRPLEGRKNKKPAAPGTIVKRINLLSKILNHARREWDIPIENVASASLVERPAGADKHKGRALTPDEEKRLLEASKASIDHPDDYWFIRWSLETACRLSESLSLTWGHIDLSKPSFTLEHTKNERYRKTHGPEERPLSAKAQALLRTMLMRLDKPPKPTDSLFSVGGANACSTRIKRRAQKLGIMNWRVHDMRHDGTTRLAKIVKSPIDLMRFTGHMDIKMVTRYCQTSIKDLAALTEED